jgi:superfamily II DNA helicase RecQ
MRSFFQSVKPGPVRGGVHLVPVDEAHCISESIGLDQFRLDQEAVI